MNSIINIVHMYPDLLNLYGDKGNIECMRKRLEWRGFSVNIIEYTNRSEKLHFNDIDIIFIGGGSDREQAIVSGKLLEMRDEIAAYVESGGVLFAVCGGFQLLGKYYKTDEATIEGLGVLDIYTDRSDKRLIGNVIVKSGLSVKPIVGFENHAGRTYIGNHTPLGDVIHGGGNDGVSGAEGVVYKNVIATYLHGPLLPKNPQLCDYLLLKAVQRRTPEVSELLKLDDALEDTANNYIVSNYRR